MNIMVVDDEKIILEGETQLIRRCAPDAAVAAFSTADAAFDYLENNTVNVVFLDLEMPDCHGVELAKRMKAIRPQVNIIFATAYRDYFETAMELHVSGYLLKPLKAERVIEELNNLRYPVRRYQSGLFVRTFGNFEVFCDGRPLLFRYQKTKELFAYLIDRRGALVTRDELITVLWGGETERSSYYKQVQKDLNDVLASIGREDVLIKQRGALGVLVDQIDCDFFDWMKGLPEGLNAYFGEYMRQYAWAEPTHVRIRAEGRRRS